MRISDWSSDGCSSDLGIPVARNVVLCRREVARELVTPVVHTAEQPGMRQPRSEMATLHAFLEQRPPGHGLLFAHHRLRAIRIDVQGGVVVVQMPLVRSAERPVGTECVHPGINRWSPYLYKKK